MLFKLQDKILLAAALVAASGSLGWFGFQALADSNRLRDLPQQGVILAAAPYVPIGRDVPDAKTETWVAPSAQRRGDDWIYDVFTPPEIFYDARTKQFSVSPPETVPTMAEKTAADDFGAPYGLTLLRVEGALFRLQLVGYVGGENTYLGLFENTLTMETFLAGRGRRLDALDLVIEDFAVRRTAVPLPESMTTNRLVATAVVRDERTGETLTLTHGERHFTEAPIATVVAADAMDSPRKVREGDRIELRGTTYKIGKIQLAPPQVDVTKESVDPLPNEPRTLKPLAEFAKSTLPTF